MSGIAGVVCADGAIPDRALLERMTASLESFAPDGSFIWSEGSLGFCHALLLTDTSSQQRVRRFSSNGSSRNAGKIINADARLDSRDELIATLHTHGAVVSNIASDAELVLAAWELWGKECLEYLHGDFAFALWDAATRELWCVRDRFGVKPLFYAHRGDTFIFGNALNSVRLHPAVSDHLDESFIGDFLLTGWNPNPAITSFRDIARLPPAHILRFQRGHVTVTRYWSLPTEEIIRYPRPETYLEEFSTVLEAAVKDRLACGSAGFLLSGGLDSTSIVATARGLCQREQKSCDFRAYTIDYGPIFEDEEPRYAAEAAQYLGIPLELVPVSDYLPYSRWEVLNPRHAEPVHDPFYALLHDHMQLAAGYSPVLITGDGGDVLLLGETWPYLVTLLKNFNFSTLAREFGSVLLKQRRLPPLLSGYPSKLRRWVTQGDQFEGYPAWLDPEWESRLELRTRWKELQQRTQVAGAVRPSAAGNITSSYWSSLWEMTNAGSTGLPVETRYPLFDLRVVRFLLRLPPLPWCANKRLFRDAMQGRLPKLILERPKTRLAADPLLELVRRKRWQPLPLPPLSAALKQFVTVSRLKMALETQSTHNLWTNLRPYSLNYWLHGQSLSGVQWES